MFILACEKHQRESKEKMQRLRSKYPNSSEREIVGHRLVEMATEVVKDDSCDECKILSEIKF